MKKPRLSGLALAMLVVAVIAVLLVVAKETRYRRNAEDAAWFADKAKEGRRLADEQDRSGTFSTAILFRRQAEESERMSERLKKAW